MNDVPAATPAPAPAPQPAAAKAQQRLIRWGGLLALLVIAILSLAVLPWVVEPWVLNKLRNGLAANGWELTPESRIGFNLYGARLHGEQLVMRMINKSADGTQAQVATADRLNAELALWESLTSSDAVIKELAIEGMTGNLRRGPDGRISSAPPEPDDRPGTHLDWSKVDWASWYQKAMEKYKQRQEEQKKQQQEKEEQAKKPPGEKPQPVPESQRPRPQVDIDWPKATKIQPLPKADRHVPRVVVRTLKISGKALKLPDESAFEVTSFTVDGSNVALRQDLGETMTLVAKASTIAAGDIALDLRRNADDTGALKIAAPAVPVEALTSPAIAGDRLAKYGASGTANLTIDNAWTGWDLTGSVVSQVTNLALQPTVHDQQTLQVAQTVNALKGKPLSWPVKIGGTLFAPTITDTGVEAVLKGSALDAAKGLAQEKATEEASKQIDKQLEKNPQAKEAADKLKNLFKK
jgi:hypothetical protein